MQRFQSVAFGPWGRRPHAHNLREGSRVAAPTAPKRNVANFENGAVTTRGNVCFQSFVTGRGGRRPNPHREVRHPSQTGESGVRGGSTTTGETGGSPTRRWAAPDTPRCELLPCQSRWSPERPCLTVFSVAVLARSRSHTPVRSGALKNGRRSGFVGRASGRARLAGGGGGGGGGSRHRHVCRFGPAATTRRAKAPAAELAVVGES